MTRGGEDRWRAAGACIIVGGFVVAAALVLADKNAARGVLGAEEVRALITMKVVEARHTPKLTASPVWFTKTISDIFIEDPNGMNLELFQTIPAPAN